MDKTNQLLELSIVKTGEVKTSIIKGAKDTVTSVTTK